MASPCLTSPLEVKFVSFETGVFEGYASVFNVTDSAGDKVAPGAFTKSLARARAEGRLPPMLWQHDTQKPIGAWRDLHEDAHGLFVTGALFTEDVKQAGEAYKLLQENAVSGLSIGYRTLQSHRERDTGVRVLTELDLLEISIVTFPANDHARVHRVKSALQDGNIPTEREFEAFLRDAGLSRKQAKGVLAHGYKALCPREADGAETHDAGDARTLNAILNLASRLRAGY
jgi:HK97 family phage prohead protease